VALMRAMRAFAVAGAFVLAVVWIRAATSASAELEAANAARAAGRIEEAIEHYQYALRWYTPNAEVPERAAQALNEVALDALSHGDRATAIDALQRLRGGARATSGLLDPFDGWSSSTHRQLATLLTQRQIAEGAPATQDATLRAARLRELNRLRAASSGGSLLIVFAFAAWLAGAVFTICRGLDRNARVVRRFAIAGSLWTVSWFALWVVGLS
jgi:tetratricopeptide (TPR) repeat protein